MDKVYCSQCRYLVPYWNADIRDLCAFNSRFGLNFKGVRVVKQTSYAEPANKKNDCKDYKKETFWEFLIHKNIVNEMMEKGE